MPYSYQPHYFDDFEVGETFESAGRTITETDVVMHAAMGGDWTEAHTNKEYAENQVFKRRVAHAPLTYQVQIGLMVRCGIFERTVIAYMGIDSLDFPNPVFFDDTLWLEAEVSRKRELESRDDGGMVALQTTMRKTDDTVVMDGQQKFLVQYEDEA